MTYKPRFRGPGKDKTCWCGSGRKAKNCHGMTKRPLAAQNPVQPPQSVSAPLQKPATTVSDKPWGVPGEEHQLWVFMMKAGQQPPTSEDVTGKPGKYKIQLLLARPGYPFTAEREHKYIDDVVGDSHIVITKPLNERKLEDAVEVLLQATGQGRQVMFTGIPNDKGYLGKLIVEELNANSFHHAEAVAYEALAPFLSAWSLHLDIPVHVETIQVTNLETHTSSLRVRTPPFEMNFAGGMSPLLTDDFCQYASMYREGMNSNSGFYRFLCFYKIIESIPLRRGRTNEAAKQAGQQVRRFHEIIPSDRDELLALLKDLYPWRTQWDSFALVQLVPDEVRGEKIGWVREKHLNPLRVGIAHALLKTGEIRITLDKLEHIQQVNKWLPLCRILARWMLRNEFPTEFGLTMQPLLVGPTAAMGRPAYRFRYSFTVNGTDVKVTRDGQPLNVTFSTTEKDTATTESALHKFLESIGQSQVNAHMVCEAIEKGQSVQSVMGSN